MIYPVGDTGSQEEFERDWYIASGFGVNRGTYYHEGLDINLRTGGDTDLGREIKAISKGRIVYYHTSHANTPNTFGRHLVYKIDGPWGSRWIHCAHMAPEDFKGSEQEVSEGQIIGRIGKSGTQFAHLHFAVFKTDPVQFGIDNIANTLAELHQYWDDPLLFIRTNQVVAPIPAPVTDQSKFDFGDGFGVIELQQARSILQDQKRNILSLESKLSQIRTIAG